MPTSESESRSGLVLELAEEFLDRYRAGERPALKDYIDRHPDLAAEIREVFPAMAMMEHIALADETIAADQNGAVTIPHLEQLGDYRGLREVGRGGMGVVYEAEQVSVGRHVALKVLPPQSLRDVKQRRRFEREARAAAKLHHTNVVPVFGVGEQEETPYYAMQFIQGQGLDAVLDELKRLRAVPKLSSHRADEKGESTAGYSSVRRDASAADVARSLLTGRFEPAGKESELPEEKPTTVPADEIGPGAPSSSSLSLPGGKSRGKAKRQNYWEGVARIGHQVADALG
jgi:eukaryotic-like serine/threonine-protein kinase